MKEDLDKLIPKKEDINLEQINEPSSGNSVAIIVTIIFLIVVGFGIYGLTIVYKNHIEGKNTEISKEEVFLNNAKECIEDSYVTRQETSTFFMTYLNQDLNYKIKGLNEEEKCVLEIEVLDANMTYNKEDIIKYVEKEENKDAVYYQYLMVKSIGEENPDEDMFQKEVTDEEKNKAIEELVLMINEDFEKKPREGSENTEGLIGNVEECVFEKLEGIDKFVENKLKGTAIPKEIKMSYQGNSGKSISVYENATCTTISK